MKKNIEITNNSIMGIEFFEPKYYCPPAKEDPELLSEALDFAKKAIERRIEHCEKELKENEEDFVAVTPNGVKWPTGHFSVPVYESMFNFLEVNSWEDVDVLMAQQVLRAIYLNLDKKTALSEFTFNIASEILLLGPLKLLKI